MAVSVPHNLDPSLPLVVDLDGTLVLTDTLHESFAKLLFSNPYAAITSLGVIAKGRAAFKQYVTAQCPVPPRALPIRPELVELIQKEKARGREVHLVTAADQKLADAIADEFDLFDTTMGSDGERNLRGANKLAYLEDRFAGGFIYAGDHRADRPIFRAARGAILCDVDRQTRRVTTEAQVPVIADLRRPPTGISTWLRLLRVHQWSKNALIFVPLVLAHAYGQFGNVATVAFAFALLCALASATYMINDIADLEVDRLHPTKRNRPFASGAIPVSVGLVGAPIIIVAALAAAYWLAPAFAMSLLAYLMLTTAYSFGLKRIALLDVFVIGALFTLRLVMGVEVLGLQYSPWLLSFACAFFLSLALAKRHAELMRVVQAQEAEIRGRGYRSGDWPITLAFGVAVGIVSVLIMLLYMANDAAPSGAYNRIAWLYAVPALVTIWLMRIWLLSHRAILHDDPVIFAVKDIASLALGLLVAGAFLLAL